MKTRKEPPHKAKTYFEKARRFQRAAQANHAAGEHDPAVSNAIHAVINLVDAVCIQASGTRSASTRHGDAIKLLGSLDEVASAVREALGKRLVALLSIKSVAEYEGELVTARQAAAAIRDLEQAFQALKDHIEGHRWA